jgi:hypothetical protein
LAGSRRRDDWKTKRRPERIHRPWGHGFSLDKSGILVNFELVQKGAGVSFYVLPIPGSSLQQLKNPVHTPWKVEGRSVEETERIRWGPG